MKRKVAVFFIILAVITGGVLVVYANTVDMNSFIGDERAQTIALELTGGGQVTVCRLSYDRGEAKYEIGINSGNAAYIIFIDAYTGDLERFTRELTTQTLSPQTQVAEQPPAVTAPQQPVTPQPQVTPQPPVATAPQQPVMPQVPVTQQVQYAITPQQPVMGWGVLTPVEARSIAMDYFGRGTIVRHETKSNYIKVCIQVGNEHHDIKINYNGLIREHKVRQISYVNSKAWVYDHSSLIGFDRAAALAIGMMGGNGVVIENELDFKKNVGLVYKIKVVIDQMEHTMEMYASNGSIYKFESKYKA